jgi:uncharacterized membrane protein
MEAAKQAPEPLPASRQHVLRLQNSFIQSGMTCAAVGAIAWLLFFVMDPL